MKKSNLWICILLIVFAANQVHCGTADSSAEEEQIFGQGFLNPNVNQSDSAFNPDSMVGGVLPDYILKPYDEVNIDIWGNLNLHYTVSISSDGYIIIPEAGRISLNGLTYSEAKRKILNHLACTYAFFINADNPGTGKAPVDITLGKTAGLNVFVTGEVKTLGGVNINGINASIINILRKSGINSQASIRKIELRKLNGKVYVFDLYDFLLKGNMSPEFKYLNDGDIIFVRLRDKDVNITGSVRRPGRYELLAEEKLNDAIKIAGGVLSGSQEEIRIFRKTNTATEKKIDEIKTRIGTNCELADKDVVDITGSIENGEKFFVTVLGEVNRPGNYTYLKHEKVNELIERCGGTNSEAFLEGAQFFRNDSLTIIDLPMALRDPKSPFNFNVMPGDRILIPRPNAFVMVKGAVISPVGIFFKEGETVDYYIKKTGGYKHNADKDNVTIITANGAIKKANKGFWSSDPPVPSGAIILVPEISEKSPVPLKKKMTVSNKLNQ